MFIPNSPGKLEGICECMFDQQILLTLLAGFRPELEPFPDLGGMTDGVLLMSWTVCKALTAVIELPKYIDCG